MEGNGDRDRQDHQANGNGNGNGRRVLTQDGRPLRSQAELDERLARLRLERLAQESAAAQRASEPQTLDAAAIDLVVAQPAEEASPRADHVGRARQLEAAWLERLKLPGGREPNKRDRKVRRDFWEMLRLGHPFDRLQALIDDPDRPTGEQIWDFQKHLPPYSMEQAKTRRLIERRRLERQACWLKEHPDRDPGGKRLARLVGQLAAIDLPQAFETLEQLEEAAPPAGAIAAEPALDIPSWPVMANAAFQGLAGKIVRRIEPHTEADKVAILAQILVCFGNVIGRKRYWRVGGDLHYCNLFCCLAGDTSKARKGTSWALARALFDQLDAEWIAERLQGGLHSAEGLIDAVHDARVTHELLRDNSGKVVGTQKVELDPGVPDKRLLCIEEEFASVLKRMDGRGNTLSALLRQAWGRGDLRSMIKGSKDKATGAHVSIIAHTTAADLRFLSSTDQENGLGNRVLWFAVRRSKCLPEGGGLAFLGDLVGHLSAAVAFAKQPGEMVFDDEARADWYRVYPELSAGRPGLAGAMTARAEAQARRLATIYALLDCSAVVAARHLSAALAVEAYVRATVHYFFGGSIGNPLAEEIHVLLQTRPAGVGRNELRDHFGRHKSAHDVARAVAALRDHGLIEITTEKPGPGSGGRPREVIKLRGCAVTPIPEHKL